MNEPFIIGFITFSYSAHLPDSYNMLGLHLQIMIIIIIIIIIIRYPCLVFSSFYSAHFIVYPDRIMKCMALHLHPPADTCPKTASWSGPTLTPISWYVSEDRIMKWPYTHTHQLISVRRPHHEVVLYTNTHQLIRVRRKTQVLAKMATSTFKYSHIHKVSRLFPILHRL